MRVSFEGGNMRVPVHTLLALISFVVLVSLGSASSRTTLVAGTTEDRNDPVATLASYYSAINARDYRLAYGFWDSPPSSFEQFARGFADTDRVRLLVEPSPRVEGAAGSVYADIPAIVVATTRGGNERVFAGCYVMRRSNVQDRGWQIYRGDLSPVSSNTRLSRILSKGCRN
jgi:hypothetical protein